MERERRTTMAENEYIARKLKEMEKDNKDIKSRREKGKADFERAKSQS